MSCIKSLPERCRLGIARVGIRTLLLVLFTYVTRHTAVLLGNSSTLNKRGENPPRCNRTTPAVSSLANLAACAQTIFSFSAVMAFHEALKNNGTSKRLFISVRRLELPTAVSDAGTGARTACGETHGRHAAPCSAPSIKITSKARAEPSGPVTGFWHGRGATTRSGEQPYMKPYRRVKGDYCGIGLGSVVTCRHRPSVL